MEEETYATLEAKAKEDARAIEVTRQRLVRHFFQECCGRSGRCPRA